MAFPQSFQWPNLNYINWQQVQSTTFYASVNNGYPVNTTSNAVTAYLPSAPVIGSMVSFTDYAGTWATNNLTVNANGSLINGSTTLTLSLNRTSLAFVYVDNIKGWIQFTGSYQTYTPAILLVAGGGGGGGNGGGGAGGYLTGNPTVVAGTAYSIVVGLGGASAGNAGNNGTQGSNSTGLSLTAIGGGYGSGTGGGVGGSGGGQGGSNGTGGLGTAGQGNRGGNTGATYSGSPGAGGGGAANAAADCNGGSTNGGNGSTYSVTGNTYAGGGGGGAYNAGFASGGNGGGSNAGGHNTSAGTATPNTGGGGGGGYNNSAGASGIVIISYTGTQRANGGSVTYNSSTNTTIHTFTTSGIFTA